MTRPAPEDRRRAFGRALKRAGLPPGARMVGLALSMYADWPAGTNARPAVAALADVTGIEVRNVRRHLSQLVAAGVVTATARRDGHPTTYSVRIDPAEPLVSDTPGASNPGYLAPLVSGDGTPGASDPPPLVPGTTQPPDPHDPLTRAPAREATGTPLGTVAPEHPNARRTREWIDRIRTSRHLPDSVTSADLFAECVRLGHGDPWAGHVLVDRATERDLSSASNPAAALRARLRGLVPPTPPPPPREACGECDRGWITDAGGRMRKCPRGCPVNREPGRAAS